MNLYVIVLALCAILELALVAGVLFVFAGALSNREDWNHEKGRE